MTTVLLVEDNADLAYGLRNNLEIEGYEVTLAEDGEQALDLLSEFSPDVVVLDVMLPKVSGFRVLKQTRERGNTVPILLLTARGEEADVVRGLRLGADDYVTKPFGLLELLARIEALLRRNAPDPVETRFLEYADIRIDLAARSVRRGGQAVPLTPKEFDLLVALYQRDGAAVSRVELIQEVWGYPASVITRTVDTHIAELRAKLESDAANPSHILTVPRIGYRLAHTPQDETASPR